MRTLLTVFAATFALAACTTAPGVTQSGGPSGVKSTRSNGLDTGVNNSTDSRIGSLSGHVTGPAGYKAPGVKAKTFGLLTASEYPVAGVEVFLASRRGERFKGPVAGRTDVDGHFEITGVPYNLTFLVMTDTVDPAAHHREICGISRSLENGTTIDISYASSLVTLSTIRGQGGNALGSLDLSIYAKAVAAVAAQLDPKNLPNLDDPKAIDAVLAGIQFNGQPLSATITQLQQGLALNAPSADAVQAALNSLNINFAGQGNVNVNGQNVANGNTQGNVNLDPNQLNGLIPGLFATPTPTSTDGLALNPSATPAIATSSTPTSGTATSGTATPTASPSAGVDGAATASASPTH
jgi:hypothetical protein